MTLLFFRRRWYQSGMRTLLVLLVLLLCFAGGCSGGPSAGDQSLIDQANSLHRAMGAAVVSDDPQTRGYLQRITARLVAAAKEVTRERGLATSGDDWMFSREIQFHIAKSTVPNVFTTGGNQFYILSGGLSRCASEDELAAAMAHSYAHTLLRHINHNLHALPADSPPPSMLTRFVEHRFSAGQEREADELAFLVHARSGWDPLAFVGMLRKMEAPAARIAAVESMLERLPPAAQEWSKPPIADVRRFAQQRDHALAIGGPRLVPQAVERLVRAMPNCFLADDLAVQKEAQRELIAPIITETPNTFEKGPRPR